MRLIARNISTVILAGCNLDLPGGSIVTIRGPSGAGKSLLLRAIADLDPHEGELWFGGMAPSANARQSRRASRSARHALKRCARPCRRRYAAASCR
ncbi:ATP-binding cassette domain-containing protein [Paracoccus methylarcula]|uniref:ATP-binding cassette domain-containing protein n=1 Tax=Paracoccus methylarcula TaxID=72022 RepID=UPI001B872951|nr:ATP-binding cassette domain-containing protein [Paracoccus methylarcula]